MKAARVKIAAARAESDKVEKGLRAPRETGAPDVRASLDAALAAAESQLRAVSDSAPEKRSPDSIGRPPTTIHGLRYLDGAFRELARAVDGADAPPSVDAERGYARDRALLDQALARWAAFKESALPRVNAALQSAGAAAIAP